MASLCSGISTSARTVISAGWPGAGAISACHTTVPVMRLPCGSFVLAFGAVGYAAIVVGESVARVELDGLVEILDGAVVLAFEAIGVTAIAVGDGRGRCSIPCPTGSRWCSR
jgi:hypothetical protein